MEKLKGALSHCLTVLVIPCLSIAAYFADPYLLVMYQRFEISMSLFGAWRAHSCCSACGAFLYMVGFEGASG